MNTSFVTIKSTLKRSRERMPGSEMLFDSDKLLVKFLVNMSKSTTMSSNLSRSLLWDEVKNA